MTSQRRYVNPRLERASRAEIDALQLQRLQRVVTRAYETNPFYRALYDAAKVHPGQIRSLQDFRERIPAIEKRTLLADQKASPPYGARVGTPGAEIRLVLHTSGTSGIGQELHYLTERNEAQLTTGFDYQCYWAGIVPGDRVVRFSRIGMELGGLWHVKAGERYGLNQFFLGAYDTTRRLAMMQTLSPHYIMTQPSYLTRLSIECEDRGLDPRKVFPDLKAIHFAGEQHGGRAWVQRLEAFWNVTMGEWYGSTQAGGSHMFSCEGGLFFADGRPRMLHNIEHRTLCEVLDPESGRPVEDGEHGEVYLTNLYNEDFPIIRFRNYDRVRYRAAGYCDCGRPFHGIESGSVSRVDDMIKMRSQNVWPDAIGAVVFSHAEVEEYQGRIWVDAGGREQIRLLIEFRPGTVAAADRASFCERLSRQVKAQTDITMTVEEAAHGTLPRFEQKARRWKDERQASREQAVERLGEKR